MGGKVSITSILLNLHLNVQLCEMKGLLNYQIYQS